MVAYVGYISQTTYVARSEIISKKYICKVISVIKQIMSIKTECKFSEKASLSRNVFVLISGQTNTGKEE